MTRGGNHAALATLVLVVAGIGAITYYRMQTRDDTVRAHVPDDAASAVIAMAPAMSASSRAVAPAGTGSPVHAARAANRERQQQRLVATQNAMAARHREERVDAAWSNTVESELASLASSDQIRAMHADIRDVAVDCRTSMCRITGDFDTVTQGDDWFTLYMTSVAARVPTATYKYDNNPDGSWRIVVYANARR